MSIRRGVVAAAIATGVGLVVMPGLAEAHTSGVEAPTTSTTAPPPTTSTPCVDVIVSPGEGAPAARAETCVVSAASGSPAVPEPSAGLVGATSGAQALPSTGSASKAVIAVAVALLLLGAAMWITARRSSTR